MADLNFPDRIERVYLLYWESVERRGWKNSFTDDVLKYFQWELPHSMKLTQKISEALFLNCNRHGEDYPKYYTVIDKMRAYKKRTYPMIIVNQDYNNCFIIDSSFRFEQFKRQFSETLEQQFFS